MRRESERGRNDWVVVFLFLSLGILLMLFAGQKGTQLIPAWDLQMDMRSNVNPNDFLINLDSQDLPPLRSDILTPPAWGDNYLTPGAGDESPTPPTFVVFDPSATPSITATPSVTASATDEPTLTTTPPVVTVTATATKTKKVTEEPPTATATTTTPTATTTTPTASATTPSPSPSPTGYPSTLDPTVVVTVSTTPESDGFNTGLPDGQVIDGDEFPDGSYFVLTVTPIVVGATPDGDYELVLYEYEGATNQVLMDQVIVGVTNADLWALYTYYEVLNWGDGVPDTNTNIDTGDLTPAVDPLEYDNVSIDTDNLYEDPASSPPPSNAQTGILIDVDGAPSQPPPGTYDMVVIIAPTEPPPDPPFTSAGDGGQIDSIDVLDDGEVPLPP